jgi:hypothetical protein
MELVCELAAGSEFSGRGKEPAAQAEAATSARAAVGTFAGRPAVATLRSSPPAAARCMLCSIASNLINHATNPHIIPTQLLCVDNERSSQALYAGFWHIQGI